MLASCVMIMAIVTSLTTLQFGMRSVDTARSMTLASQIMQSEMEIIRLQNWAQITALDGTHEVSASTTITTGSGTTLDATLTNIASGFRCYRTVEAISGRADIRRIALQITWLGVDGRSHQLSYETRYAKNGLSDYFYVAH